MHALNINRAERKKHQISARFFFNLEKIYLQVIELTQLLNISTRETADILASPSPATMSVSALPTSLKSSCSKNNGITRRRISFVVNREYLLSSVRKRSLFRNMFSSTVQIPSMFFRYHFQPVAVGHSGHNEYIPIIDLFFGQQLILQEVSTPASLPNPPVWQLLLYASD